jgi:hypothetical protein
MNIGMILILFCIDHTMVEMVGIGGTLTGASPKLFFSY